jgi:hypothetical protein
MTFFRVVTQDQELYVYIGGVLIYKRWKNGGSLLFDKFGPPISNKDRDRLKT